jgi:bifunctional non-homologous end joining protein LigD
MLLKSFKEKSLKKYEGTHIAQEKFDGTRIIVTKKDNLIYLQTRSGKNDLASEYPEIVKELLAEKLKGFIIDAELVFFRKDNGKAEFLTGLAKTTRYEYEVILKVFDVLESDGVNLRSYSQELRTLWVHEFCNSGGFSNIEEVYTYYQDFDTVYSNIINNGGEGLVLKKKTGIYQDGKRSSDWLKVKKQDTTDCFIVGLMEGDGKWASTFGSLILAQYNKDGEVVVICNCSGFTDQVRAELYNTIISTPWNSTFDSSKGELTHIVHKCEPTLVVEIEFMERLESGSVRHPRFVRIRTDKLIKDCVYG